MIFRLVFIFQLIILSLSILSFFSDTHYLIDITSHFKHQYFLISILFFFILVFSKNRNMILVSFLSIFINAIEIKDYLPYKKIHEKDNTFSVMSYNVMTSNKEYKKLINLVKKEKPDVLVLQEVDNLWDENLTPLYLEYKHVIKKLKSDNFGIVLLTNQKPLNSEIVYYDPKKNIPSIKAILAINNEEYTFIGTHPVPPVNAEYHASRDLSLNNMIEDINENRTFVIGDLNTSMWSHGYKNIKYKANLKNAREGFGIQPSWSTNPILFPFQTPIDHIMVTNDIKVINFKTLENIGSDHKPIISFFKL